MRYLLLPQLAALALPTAVHAGLSDEEKREICARYWEGQITHQDAASRLSLKEPSHTEIGWLKKAPKNPVPLQRAALAFCIYIKGTSS